MGYFFWPNEDWSDAWNQSIRLPMNSKYPFWRDKSGERGMLLWDLFGRDAKLECTRTCVTSPDRDISHSERRQREKVRNGISLLVG